MLDCIHMISYHALLFPTRLHISGREYLYLADLNHSQISKAFDNFIVNTLGAWAAYCFFPKKQQYLQFVWSEQSFITF